MTIAIDTLSPKTDAASSSTATTNSSSSLSTVVDNNNNATNGGTSTTSATTSIPIVNSIELDDSSSSTSSLPSSSCSYTMKDAAYIVMVLHAAKYASSSVTGLLLGHEQEEHGDDANTTTANDIQKTIIIDEALPLAHSDTTHFTTALAQIALMLAEQRATTMRQSSHATHNKHKLVGVYYASAIPGDPGIPTPPTRIADRIRQLHCTDAVLLHLDEERLRPSVRTQKHCARVRAKRNLSSSGVIGRIPSDQKKQPKQQKDGPWGRATLPDQALRVSQSALGMTHYLLASPPKKDVPISPYDVVDFEDHCTDPRYDWLNGQVVAKVPFDVPET